MPLEVIIMRWTQSASAQPLRELMEGRDFNHVAKKVNVKPELLAKWLSGIVRPSLVHHMTLAKVLGVPADLIAYPPLAKT